MILSFADDKQIRGDLIRSAVIRSDLAPIPLTLEAEIGVDSDDLAKRLAEGGVILAGGNGDAMRIIQSREAVGNSVQGDKVGVSRKIVAILDACHQASFVRGRAIVKEKTTIAGIYKVAGANIKAVEQDIVVPRFCCFVGDTPTFRIAQVLQEEGGVVRWKNGKMQFMRLTELIRQEPVITLSPGQTESIESGFLERHSVPSFFSTDQNGETIMGNNEKPRAARFSPFKTPQQLRNMTRSIVHRTTSRLPISWHVAAGDIVECDDGQKLVVITAAHAYKSKTDSGGAQNIYTRLWCGSIEG